MSMPARRTLFRNVVAAWTGIGGSERVLYVSAESLIALRRDEDGWHLERTFQLEESDDTLAGAPPGVAPSTLAVPEEFGRWIEHWRGDRFRVLVDSVDEEVETDELPRVQGRDRVKVLNRRLRQRFRDAALTTWIAPGRPESSALKRAWRARADAAPAGAAGAAECTMMAALRQRNPMALWIEAAVGAGARISSIESPTLRAPSLLRRLGPRPTALLVSVQPAGLRETLVQDGEIRFTRLLPLATPVPWSQVASELVRTLRFLMMSRASLRALIQAGSFPVHLLTEGIDAPPGARAFPASLPLDGDIVAPIVALDAPALRMPPVQRDAGSMAPPVLGALPALLRRRSPRMRGQYARAAMRRNWRNARSLASVWSLALISLVATVGANVWIAYALHDSVDPAIERQRLIQIQTLGAQARELEQHLASLAARAPDMQGVIELADQLQSRHVDALATLQLVAGGLQDDASLTINDLWWEPQRPLVAAGPPGTVAHPQQPAAGAAGTATTDSVVRLAGLVDPALSKELANRRVDELLARLRAACGCAGRVLELPYDPSMDVAYSNSLRKPTEHAPHFTLELERPSRWLAAPADAAADKRAGTAAGGHHDA